MPHVVVVADRSGAVLHAFDGRVEGTVKRNLQQIAREIERLVGEVHAELVVLGGEVQARTAVRNELNVAEDLVV